MKRLMGLVMALALLLSSLSVAQAATRLNEGKLVCGGQEVALSVQTGYLAFSGSTLMAPVKAACEGLGLNVSASRNGKKMTVTSAEGKKVEIASGYRYIRVNGKKKNLRAKAFVQKGGALTADVRFFTYLDMESTYSKAERTLSVQKKTVVKPEDSFAAELPAAKTTDQLVVVRYQSGSKAELTLHEKQDGVWRQLLKTTAYVGRNGIGKTREGDGKTPTGTFSLTKAFGIKSNPGTSMKYTKVTKYHYWCGTSGDPYYNQMIDTRVTKRARKSSDEYLIRYSGYYDYCLFIDYNAEGEAGKGSCIFLHCLGSKKSTAGCVAIPQSDMIKILKTIKNGAKIVIG